MDLLNLKLTLNQNGSITASWSALPGAVRYQAHMSVVGQSYSIYNERNITGTSYTSESNLAANKQYSVSVYAFKSGDIQFAADNQKIWILNDFYNDKPLDVPQNVKATAGTTVVTVSFDKVSRATGYDILFDNTVYSVTTTSKSFTGLQSKTPHTYAVRAKNAYTTGAYSNTQSIMTQAQLPAVPRNIKKTATETSATISWGAVSGATGYDIQFNGANYSTNSTSRTFTGLTAGVAYSFAVRSRNTDGTSAYTAQTTVTTPPKAPTTISATSTSNSVTVNWNAVSGASGYTIKFNNADYQMSASSTSYTFKGLTQKTLYSYQICCRSIDGSGAYSSVRSVETLPQTPAVPTNVRKVVAGTSATISWNAASSATGYNLEFNGTTYSVSDTSKTFTGLTVNRSYPFKICAKNGSVIGNYTSEMTVTTAPVAPASISATSAENSVTVSWSAVSGAAGYTISFDNTKYNTSASSTSRTFNGLKADTSYNYQVCSRSVDGEGVYSGTKAIKTLMSIPTGVSHKSTDTSAMVSWNAVSGASGYDLLFNQKTYATTGTSKQITGLSANSAYPYRVRSKSSNGSVSDYSAERTVRTTPKAPQSSSATTSENSATVSWGAVSGAISYDVLFNGASYRISRTSCTINGLAANTNYSYQIRSNNADGSSAYGSVKTVRTAPTAPSSSTATATTNSVTVSWGAVSGATSYDVRFNGTTYRATGTSHTISGLKPGTNYSYQIRSNNADGSSSYCAARTASTLQAPPEVPTNITATSTVDSITVKWGAVSGATSYDVKMGDSTYHTTSASRTISGLKSNTSYTYQVRANNAVGSSAYSIGRTIKTQIAPPTVPTNVRATPSSNSITVSWNAVSGATSYELRLNSSVYTVSGTSKTITGLAAKTTYSYQVRAKNSAGTSAYSVSQQVRTLDSPPAMPANVTATATTDSVTVRWNAVSNAGNYNVRFDGSVYNGTKTSRTFTGLEPDTAHTYAVCAVNEGGSSRYSTQQSIRTRPVIPAVPQIVSTLAEAHSVEVTWQGVSGAKSYELLFNGTTYALTDTTKKVEGLASNTEYSCQVRAKNEAGVSAYCEPQTVRTCLDMPSDVMAAATMDTVVVSWSPVEGATDYDVRFDDIDYHVAENWTITTVPRTYSRAMIGSVLGEQLHKIFTGLEPNTQHSYCVRANNEEGSSPYTPVQYITTELQKTNGLVQSSDCRTYPDGRRSYFGNDPINALTGAFLWSHTWIEDYSKDKLHFTTMYDSQRDAGEGVLGRKWTYSLNYLLRMDEEYAYFYTPYGDVITFGRTAESSLFEPVNGTASPYSMKTKEEDTYSVEASDGTEYIFDKRLCLNQIVENGLVSYRFQSNDAGQIIRIEGRHGAGIDIVYIGGCIASVTDAMGNASSFSYENGRLMTVTNPDGGKVSFTYDDACNLLTISDLSGEVYLTNTYDMKGRVTEQLTAGRGKSLAAYDEENRVTSFTDELGNVTRYTYDEAGHITAVALGETAIHNRYNEKGQIIGQTDALGNSTQMEYDECGRMNRVVYPDGTEESVVYNDRNQPSKVVGRDGAVNLYQYDAHNNLIEMQDERGNANSYTYDENDNLTSFTDRSGNVWTYAYDGNNHLKQAVDPDGNSCFYTHDAIGRMTSYTSPAGRTISYQYSAAGNLLSIEDADGKMLFEYNENGNRTGITDKMGNKQRLEYNKMGQISLATDCLGNEYRFAYDEKGNLITETDPLGYSVSRTYDAFGNRTSQTDKNGGVTHYAFDAANQLIQVRDAAGGTVSYTYDCMGRVTAVTDQLSHQRSYAYDSVGRVIRETDALEHSVSYTYDEAGNLLTRTDEDGYVTAYTYDTENRLQSIQTDAGTTAFTYDKLGRISAVTDTDGYVESAQYDSDGNLTVSTDKESRETRYTYDSMGRIAEETAPNGGKTVYVYDKNGNCVQVTDAEGHASAYEYDANNRLVKAVDPIGQATAYAYDGMGRLTRITDANGGITEYSYDGNGNLTAEKNPLGGEKTYAYDGLNRLVGCMDEEGNTWAYTYDAAGNRTSFTDANGNCWTYAYDANNRLTSVTDQNEGSLTLAYTNTGRISSVTDMEGAVTGYQYDAMGRLTQMSDAMGHSVAFTYDSTGRLLTQTDANGNTTEYDYSPTGNLLSVKDAEGNATVYTYNALGQVTSMTDALGNTGSYSYDLLGQVTSMTDALGNTTAFTYTADGRIATVENAEGNVTRYSYDACGNLTQTEDALGNIVMYEYDAMNNRIKECLSKSEEQSCITLYQYDKKGRMIREINPMLEEKAYGYDGNDNMVSVTDEEQRETVVTYDLNNKPVAMTYSDGRTAAFRYNKRGELVEMQDWNGITAMEHDSLGRLTSVTDHQGRMTGFTYDAVGNRTGIQYPDGSAAAFAYDRNNRLLQVMEDADEISAQYAYDAAGNIISLTQPGSAASYTYNANRQPIKAAYQFGEAVFMDENITYDVMGRIIGSQRTGSREEFGRIATYAYDAIGQLISYQNGEIVEAYTYDAVGNRTTKSLNGIQKAAYQYNALNQLTALSEDGVAYSFGYDKCGNLTEEYRGDDLVRQYVYDTAGRMTLGKNIGNGEESAYTYNALHMCVKNVQRRVSADGFYSREMQYVPDFLSATNNELMAYETGVGSTRTVFGYAYQRLSQSTASGKTFFQSDIYGSPLFAADAQGAALQYADRNIWGSLKSGTEAFPGLEENLRFSSYRYDPVIGKHFAYARFYDDTNGRMLALDPVRRGLNQYRYCDNDPVDHVDSTGEVLEILGGIVLGGIFGLGSGVLSSAIDQKKRGKKVDWWKALGAGINGAITGAAQGGLLASGAGIPAALLTNFFAGMAGSAAEQYIGTGKIDTRRSITHGLTNAISNAIYGTNPLGSVKEAFLRGAGAGAATSGINYLSDTLGQRQGWNGRQQGLLPWTAGGAFSPYELLQDPRLECGSLSPFIPSLGYSSARGYQYSVPQEEETQSQQKKFSMWDFLGEVAMGGLTGGFTSAAFYGAGKGVEKLREGNRLSNGGRDPFDSEMMAALDKLDDSGLRPGQTVISKEKIRYIVDNYDSVKAQSSIYTDPTGRYLVEGHHTTVANAILNRGVGMNMNQTSPLPPSVTNIYWTKKWYEFWKTPIKIEK